MQSREWQSVADTDHAWAQLPRPPQTTPRPLLPFCRHHCYCLLLLRHDRFRRPCYQETSDLILFVSFVSFLLLYFFVLLVLGFGREQVVIFAWSYATIVKIP